MDEIEKMEKKLGIMFNKYWITIKALLIWMFVSFLFPLVQYVIMRIGVIKIDIDESYYNIIFATFATFLTGIFFSTDFWKNNRWLIRIMLIVSYLISFGLFIISLLQSFYKIEVFKTSIYEWGMILTFVFSLIVGFYSKYDENVATANEIAESAKKHTKVNIYGQNVNI